MQVRLLGWSIGLYRWPILLCIFTSVNQFSILSCPQGIQYLAALESLNLYYNCISLLAEVFRLHSLKELADVDFRLNPVVKNEPDYRLFVVRLLPKLRQLGGCRAAACSGARRCLRPQADRAVDFLLRWRESLCHRKALAREPPWKVARSPVATDKCWGGQGHRHGLGCSVSSWLHFGHLPELPDAELAPGTVSGPAGQLDFSGFVSTCKDTGLEVQGATPSPGDRDERLRASHHLGLAGHVPKGNGSA